MQLLGSEVQLGEDGMGRVEFYSEIAEKAMVSLESAESPLGTRWSLASAAALKPYSKTIAERGVVTLRVPVRHARVRVLRQKRSDEVRVAVQARDVQRRVPVRAFRVHAHAQASEQGGQGLGVPAASIARRVPGELDVGEQRLALERLEQLAEERAEQPDVVLQREVRRTDVEVTIDGCRHGVALAVSG